MSGQVNNIVHAHTVHTYIQKEPMSGSNVPVSFLPFLTKAAM